MLQGMKVVVRPNGDLWDAEIVRRRKRRPAKIIKAQSGFSSELEANAWAESEIAQIAAKRAQQQEVERLNSEKREAERIVTAKEKIESLTKCLEDMHPDVYVIDADYHGNGVFSLKIQTPVTVYLSSGTEADWVRQIKADIKAVEDAACPFCGTKVKMDIAPEQPGCRKCKAKNSHDPKSLLTTLGYDCLSPDEALHVLANMGDFFRENSARHLWWGRTATDLAEAAGSMLSSVTGPDDSASEGELPLLVDTDVTPRENIDAMRSTTSVDEVVRIAQNCEEGCLSLPNCRFCVHAVDVTDNSDAIIGVETSYWYNATSMCVYPLNGAELKDAHPNAFDFEPEKIRGYRTNEDGILKNVLVSQVLSDLSEVNDRCRGLEAKAEEPFGFFGPICRNFELNENHPDIGYIYERLAVKVPVRYGIVDAERERQERVARIVHEEALRIRKETEATIRALREDPQNLAVMKARIEKRNLNGSEAKSLVTLMAEHLPMESCLRGDVFSQFPWAFDLSNSAASVLDGRLKAEVRAKTN